MPPRIVRLDELAPAHHALVGAKALNLGELRRLDGLRVPPGVCLTTVAFREHLGRAPAAAVHLDALGGATQDALLRHAAELRRLIEEAPFSPTLSDSLSEALASLGAEAFAVRSSSTAEDLPDASFAGQHDTSLNVVGLASVLVHVRRCWASLFSDRAVSYRHRHRLDHRAVEMAVILQPLLAAKVSGVLFTVDPLTSNRTITTIEAAPGLGDALVSGLVTPDVFTVRAGQVVSRSIAEQRAAPRTPALSDPQVLALERIGRRVEAHFGHPRDLEWCLVGDELHVLQSRPITTLFPIPQQPDQHRHVYISVGHQQMMTEAMSPLGLSFYQLCSGRPMADAGGRLFVDVTMLLANPSSRAGFLTLSGRADPLLRAALETVIAREGFLPPVAASPSAAPPTAPPPLEPDLSIVERLIRATDDSLAKVARDLEPLEGLALLDFIADDVLELRRLLSDPTSTRAIMAAMESTWWLADHLRDWLDDPRAADSLAQGAPFNVTAELGLALLDVADLLRPHPELVAFLETVTSEAFLDELPRFSGGTAFRDALGAFLERHGARCVGEIDLSRVRWAERPSTVLPILLGHVRAFDHGEAARRRERGLREAERAEADVLSRLRALPDGTRKAAEAALVIQRLRTFIGYREFPKYGMVRRLFIYKRALLREGVRLVRDGLLTDETDLFFLRFDELREAVRRRQVDLALLRRRRDELRGFQSLVPPRVLTSEGECLSGTVARSAAPGALVGVPVSAGVVEGRARVLRTFSGAPLEPGDILVTTATDPAWTPLFLAASGLVTEVGGLMTHGSVIAREFGIPAVVAVERATERIRDGQRLRVDGTNGLVEFLD